MNLLICLFSGEEAGAEELADNTLAMRAFRELVGVEGAQAAEPSCLKALADLTLRV